MLAVIEAEYPIPSHVEASSARPAAWLMPLQTESPTGPHEGVPSAFVWRSTDVPPPYALVVLDDGYTELARIEDIGPMRYVPPMDLAGLLGTGGGFHWFVEGSVDGRPTRSPLTRLEIR